jgi:UDP-N-acetylglucosamine--N-acetylmuramyl-(pentapeptide) pyrophosphoryl-undecaprenol N-acetylglucosamine transferase
VGNPVRPPIRALANLPYAPPGAEGPIRILVTGGSQGARLLSELVPEAIAALPDALRTRLVVQQQTRVESMETARRTYRNAVVEAEIAPFFRDMAGRLAAAHLVIGRSGAGTVAELMAIGRPAILVPLPHALDDNQTPNAEILSRAGAGWAVAQSEMSPDSLARMLIGIFAKPQDLADRAAAAHALAVPDATEKLADMVESLARNSA